MNASVSDMTITAPGLAGTCSICGHKGTRVTVRFQLTAD